MKAEPIDGLRASGQVTRSRWSLSVADRQALLVVSDLLAVNGGLLGALALRSTYAGDVAQVLRHPHWFGLLSVLYALWAWALDAYEPRVIARFSTSARVTLFAGLASTGLYLLIPYVTPPLPASRFQLFALPLLVSALLLASRGFYAVLLTRQAVGRRVLIVGAGWAGRTLAEAMTDDGDRFYAVIGFVDDDPAKQGTSLGRWEVLGDRTALPALIRRYQVDTLAVAITWNLDARLVQALMDCLELGVEVVSMPALYEQLTGRVPIEHVGNHWHVAMPVHHPLTRPFNRAVKRGMDILLAGLGLLFLAPLFPVIALAIYLDCPGPIFYTQERVGKEGRIFRAYKFRSMVPDAERGQAVWAQENDPRVTRVGRFLRKTHIDELPQLLNILKGEMSAVGPRPERPEFVKELAREIPFYRVRQAVKPGMAGWAQVKYGYASSKEDAVVKLQYDLYYMKHWSPWFDLVILLKTVLDTVMLRGRA